MKSDLIRTKSARIWLGDDGIVRVITLPGSEMALKDAKQNVLATERFGEERRPFFVDITEVKSVSQEAREYYASYEASKRIRVCAMLVGSPVSRVIGNFFLGLNKPQYPVRLFISEEKALGWLKYFVK